MFGDLFDALSYIYSWHWPVVEGEITVVEVERLRLRQHENTLRLSVTYKFSVGDDGPYTGESFWQPPFCTNKRVVAARHKLHRGQHVIVRYRPDDPSVNRLDRSVWRFSHA
jgi:hypothetical protein